MPDTQVEPDALSPGDWIEISVSHQVRIDREESWIKLGANTKVREDETASEAVSRLSTFINNKVIDVIADAVDVVRNQA